MQIRPLGIFQIAFLCIACHTTQPLKEPIFDERPGHSNYVRYARINASEGVNLRSGPGSSYMLQIVIPKGSIVPILEWGDSVVIDDQIYSWWRTEYNGFSGWFIDPSASSRHSIEMFTSPDTPESRPKSFPEYPRLRKVDSQMHTDVKFARKLKKSTSLGPWKFSEFTYTYQESENEEIGNVQSPQCFLLMSGVVINALKKKDVELADTQLAAIYPRIPGIVPLIEGYSGCTGAQRTLLTLLLPVQDSLNSITFDYPSIGSVTCESGGWETIIRYHKSRDVLFVRQRWASCPYTDESSPESAAERQSRKQNCTRWAYTKFFILSAISTPERKLSSTSALSEDLSNLWHSSEPLKIQPK